MKFQMGRVVITSFVILLASFIAAPMGFAAEKVSPSFNLGPGDVLAISVWRDEELNRQVLVRPDGMISFPLIGDIVAAGKTVDELRQEIEEKIVEYVPDTKVTVMLIELASPKVFVVGQVNQPGMFIMTGDTTVMQALAWAGGLTPFASSGSIRIIRTGNGHTAVLNFDYDDVEDGEDLAQNVILQPGDTIVVP